MTDRGGMVRFVKRTPIFCVPQAKFLGVTPQDILDYNLPTHPLKDVDIKRAKDALKNDPF